MPEFIRYPVRDRKSWEFYKERFTLVEKWSFEKIDKECLRFDKRTKPLVISGGSTWGGYLLSLRGPELACTILCEVKAGNNLLLRKKYPDFVFFGMFIITQKGISQEYN